MFKFKLPDLGEGIHEGELLKWYIKQGDNIIEDDPLCDLETDKAAVTIPSPRTGIIDRLNGTPGDIIQVGEVLVEIDETNPQEKSWPRTPEKALEKMVDMDNTPDENTTPDKPIPRVIAAPATRRLAREMNIEIRTITGTGPGKRVTREDLLQFQSTQKHNTRVSPNTGDTSSDPIPEPALKPGTNPIDTHIPFLEVAPLPDYEATGPVEKIPIRSLRKKIATKTTSSMILVPHVAHMEECDVTDLDTIRKTFNQDHADMGRLTLLSFVIKALASLLKTYPEFNAAIDPDRMEIIYKKFYHIGFATTTPRGLIVPVIKNADQKNVTTIADQLKSLSKKGRDGSITIQDLTGGTFSVTNVGAIGGTGMVPTINYPETAILGMGRIHKKPVVKDDTIVIRSILPITLCFDHRVADGARAAHFVNDLKLMLENTLIFMTMI